MFFRLVIDLDVSLLKSKKNHSFCWKLQILMKTVDFVENCVFCLKPVLMKTMFLMKTMVFGENCGFWADLRSETAKSTFPFQPSRGQHQTLKSVDFCQTKDHLPKNAMPIFVLHTQLTPFKTIWLHFCIVYSVDSFQDHLTQFYHCVPNWLLWRPFDLIFVLWTQLTPFKTIWPDFCIVYPVDSLQDHFT